MAVEDLERVPGEYLYGGLEALLPALIPPTIPRTKATVTTSSISLRILLLGKMLLDF